MFNTLSPESLYTFHRGKLADSRYPSPDLWGGEVRVAPSPDMGAGWITHFEDFIGHYDVPTADTWFDRYDFFSENSGTLRTEDAAGGVIRLATGATADNTTAFGMNGRSGIGAMAVGSAGAVTSLGTRSIFEARIRVASVADSVRSFFVGLAAKDLIADNGLIADDHTLASASFVGFASLMSDGDAITPVYRVAGSGAQTLTGSVKAIAVNTWYKIGLVYDPNGPINKKVKFFFDGQELPIGITEANVKSALFPAGTRLAPAFFLKTDAAASHTLDVDWLAYAHEE